ncbi:MAG: FKBP-type peptidyl-prolyl cis-trans isomerase [Gemmatimonadetes bacterium]|nr:FKBP-type peptidyl-prolyl cis-trans isomerase [Gemmatimonadota bacterium]
MRNRAALLALAAAAVLFSGCLEDNGLTDPGTCQAPKLAIPTLNGDTVTTANGVKYLEPLVGNGATAQATSQVTVTYNGYLTDGTLFARGSLSVLNLPDVIPGFREGVVGMKAGGIRRLIIPPAQGFGTAGSGSCVPSGATLIFDVNLVGSVL